MNKVPRIKRLWKTVPQSKVLQFIEERAKQALFVEEVVLFGSRARGDARAFSDYDLAFRLAVGTSKVRWLAFKTDLDEEAPTLCRISALEWTESIRPSLAANIVKEGVKVYER